MVAEMLEKTYPDLRTETIVIQTSGDWRPADGDTRLSEALGGKGQFATEIESALQAGEIHCGVHSLKDMPSFLPEGLVIEHVLPREDPRDAFLCMSADSPFALPEGAIVGTASLRRQALLLAKRPDLKIVPLRGNVETRIAKIENGQADATILAMAGLRRLNLDKRPDVHPISVEDMLPACGQGIVGIEIREDDSAMRTLLNSVHCRTTALCAAAERAALQILDGSCHTPIGAYAIYENGKLLLRAVVAASDGSELYEEERQAPVMNDAQAAELGQKIGETLKSRVPPELLA